MFKIAELKETESKVEIELMDCGYFCFSFSGNYEGQEYGISIYSKLSIDNLLELKDGEKLKTDDIVDETCSMINGKYMVEDVENMTLYRMYDNKYLGNIYHFLSNSKWQTYAINIEFEFNLDDYMN